MQIMQILSKQKRVNIFTLFCLESTVEPCYNEDLATMKITLCQVSHYIRVKGYELGPDILQWKPRYTEVGYNTILL